MRDVFPPEKHAIAVYPLNNWGGLEITAIEEACVEVTTNNGRHKIYQTSQGRAYFIMHGSRYYLDKFTRV